MKNLKFKNIYITIILIIIYIPILFVILYSFNASKSNSIWAGFTLKWYLEMLKDRNLADSLKTSLIVAFSSAFIAAVIGTLGAVSVNRINKKLASFITSISYIPIIIPEIIIGVALLMFFSILPLQYGIATLILAHSTFCIPYVFIMVQISINATDKYIYEAAVDLGASQVTIFFTITLPLIMPAVISGSLLALAMSLDDVIISIFLSGPQSTTLPVKIFSMLKLGVTPKINALCTSILVITFSIVTLASILYKKIISKENF